MLDLLLESLFIFFLSIGLSYFLIRFFSLLFQKIGIMDNPKKYGHSRQPVPYSMGIIFVINFLILSLFFIDYSSKYFLLAFFGTLITIISFFDDRLNISPKFRLLVQIIIGITIGITSIKIGYISNIFGGIINLETYFFELFSHKIYIIPLLFTTFWYVLIFNSLNWSDGVTGLTSGISFISFFVLFLLALILFGLDNYDGAEANAKLILVTASILMGSLLVFWIFDIREKILMGDSGTMFLGFMLASLAIIAGGKIATVGAVFGIYLVDAFYVIITRLLRKQNPLKGDYTHLHHRLKDVGLTKKEILITIYSLSLIFGISALFLDKSGKIIVFIIIAFVVIFITKILDKIKN